MEIAEVVNWIIGGLGGLVVVLASTGYRSMREQQKEMRTDVKQILKELKVLPALQADIARAKDDIRVLFRKTNGVKG